MAVEDNKTTIVRMSNFFNKVFLNLKKAVFDVTVFHLKLKQKGQG